MWCNAHEELMNWYVDYCEAEFDKDRAQSAKDFISAYQTNDELGILYTDFEDDDEDGDGECHDIQVSLTFCNELDHIGCDKELIYVDGELLADYYYKDIEEMCGAYIYADFNDIWEYAHDMYRMARDNKKAKR